MKHHLAATRLWTGARVGYACIQYVRLGRKGEPPKYLGFGMCNLYQLEGLSCHHCCHCVWTLHGVPDIYSHAHFPSLKLRHTCGGCGHRY